MFVPPKIRDRRRMPPLSHNDDRKDEGSVVDRIPVAPHLPPRYDADDEITSSVTPMMALALVCVNDGVFANDSNGIWLPHCTIPQLVHP
jgi:hypothetical protein